MLAAIAAQRLQNQFITRAGPRNPASIVARLGAMQAQEFAAATWGLALRMPPGTTLARVTRAIDEGRILRTHVMRPTWHFVTPQDIRWMLDLTAPQVHKRMAPYDRHLELDAKLKVRAAQVFERALRDGAFLTRAELGAQLARAKISAATTRLAHLVMYAELEGVLCSGPRLGKKSTYALLASRAPQARSLPRDEALGELARRFFRTHGPATVRDFAWWSGLKAADARRGLEITRARPIEADGLKYWTTGPRAAPRMTKGRVDLLPIYDEYIVAYVDRQAVSHHGYAFGDFLHTLVIDGQVAGSWRPRPAGKGVTIEVDPGRRLRPAERRSLDAAVARYARFLGVPVVKGNPVVSA